MPRKSTRGLEPMPRLRTCLLHEIERKPGLLVRTLEGHPIEASTVGEAISAAESLLGIRLSAEKMPGVDPNTYFRLGGVPKREGSWLGITIYRNGEKIYPGHDLTVPIQERDVFAISVLCD